MWVKIKSIIKQYFSELSFIEIKYLYMIIHTALYNSVHKFLASNNLERLFHENLDSNKTAYNNKTLNKTKKILFLHFNSIIIYLIKLT